MSRQTSALERSKSSAEERPKWAAGGSIVGTKKEEKQNFRVRFLHAVSNNYLILFIYPSSPSIGAVAHSIVPQGL